MGSRTSTSTRDLARTRGRVPARTPHRAPGRSLHGDPRRDGPAGGATAGGGVPRRWVALVVVLSVLVGAGAALVLRSALTTPSSTDRQAAALEQAEVERDAVLAEDLVASATSAHADVLAVVTTAEDALADDPAALDALDAEQATTWTNEVVTAGAPFSEQVSGGTRVNLTRAGLAHATALLEQALRTYRDAATAQAGQQDALRAAADELFRAALVGWSIAATELDDLAVAHDLGHVHLYLTDDPSTGAITSHDEPGGEGERP